MVERVERLQGLLRANRQHALEDVRERLERSTFVLAVVGEFSSGKSFLLNALLGHFDLLATDINPSTATITQIEYAPETHAVAYYSDGRAERIPLDHLSRFIAVAAAVTDAGAIHDATKTMADAPERITVQIDSEFLRRGFTVADTPGLASINPAHRRATLQFLPGADAVLYLIDTQQPFTEGDASFLEIIRQHVDTIFIVQTKIDLWEEATPDGRAIWEGARDRIMQFAAVYAPGTYVYALSARRYVEGMRSGDQQLVERSRFLPFTQALDASLVQHTGRARLARARDRILRAATDETALLAHDRQTMALPGETLIDERAKIAPFIEQLTAQTSAFNTHVLGSFERLTHAVQQLGVALRADAQHALERTFDSADISRLADRAHLHILIDRSLGQSVEVFARNVSSAAYAEYRNAAAGVPSELPVALSFARAASAASADPGDGALWTEDPQRAFCASIVLAAIGGPAISLAHAISLRFSSARAGTYMKRELTADLRSAIWPQFDREMQRFVDAVAARVPVMAQSFVNEVTAVLEEVQDRAAGSIERALEHQSRGEDPRKIMDAMREREQSIERTVAEIAALVDEFLERGHDIAPPDAGAEAVRRSHVEAEFDREAYRLGLRPQRWRVAVLGALRRGKSSLINAFAGRRVLADEVAGAIAYPVHVRYGEQEGAFALQPSGEWQEVEIESALEEAARNPVLIVTPWKLPRELVLVHAPAFDAGDTILEDVCTVAAREANEVLCLFSRQLSDRELSLYGRIAVLGKPMMFAHTLADNESASERRGVMTLASQYLRERNIPVERMFVVSTLEYAQAKREHRAPAGWNELDALISTVTTHAEEHMARLQRLARASASPAAKQPPAKKSSGFFQRLLGRE